MDKNFYTDDFNIDQLFQIIKDTERVEYLQVLKEMLQMIVSGHETVIVSKTLDENHEPAIEYYLFTTSSKSAIQMLCVASIDIVEEMVE